jgi:small subunit ribosomal protein S16
MVKLRLARIGLKKQPVYRIVAIEERNARNGKPIEILGQYNPRTRPSTEIIDEGRALYWLSVGAQPTEAVAGILRRAGTTERFARFRAGETIEALTAEAAAAPKVAVDARTRYPAPEAGQSWVKAKEAAAKAAKAAK